MRLPHHLLRQRFGIYHFRLVVLLVLHGSIGKRVIKRNLGTKDPAQAKLCAYVLGAQYAQAFAKAWGRDGIGRGNDDHLAGLRGIEIEPLGDSYAIKTNGTDSDNAAALTRPRALPAGWINLKAPSAPVAGKSARTLDNAFDTYADVEARDLRPDAWQQRERTPRVSWVAFFRFRGTL